jgi:hypothetical protein
MALAGKRAFLCFGIRQGCKNPSFQGILFLMFKSFRSEKSAELLHQPGLEYWFKERRTSSTSNVGHWGLTLTASPLTSMPKDILTIWGRKILGMCCHLNAFLIDQGITKCDDLSEVAHRFLS